ncbi:MAG: uracil-DNA glycosylase [Verrucomicrobia bacterium]|nr:uracil-DNA glycosylase [Verrucomicrobiota bacterium]
MNAELRQHAARYVELLRRHGKKEAWLPTGLARRLPSASTSATPAPLSSPTTRTTKSEPPSALRSAPPIPSPKPKNDFDLNSILKDVSGSKADKLAALRKKTDVCKICAHLAKSRTQVVFGVGDPEAKLMFVGEAPGAEEDKQGEPFVGLAGKLLTKMITAMELTREQVYIANVLKCRPDMPANTSGNRKPTRTEMDTCLPYLRAQVAIIAPTVIVALGSTAVEGLFGPQKTTISRLRGTWMELDGVPVRPTFHPSYLLHNQDLALKRLVWTDLMAAMEKLSLPISEKQRGYFLKPTA